MLHSYEIFRTTVYIIYCHTHMKSSELQSTYYIVILTRNLQNESTYYINTLITYLQNYSLHNISIH